MAAAPSDRRNFFVSFNSANREKAEWIAHALESAGYTTYFQHWDFRPGSNFVLEMHKAAALSDRTIAVLSQDYLDALFTQPEWAAALLQDPDGQRRKLIPIRVSECKPDGLLGLIVYEDLVGLDESDALRRLLAAVSEDRPKPETVSYENSGAPSSIPPKPSAGPPRGGNASGHRDLRLHAALSAACFLVGGLLLAMMIGNAETLARFGLTGRLFYIVLIPVSLSVAGFLFGVLRSVATYRGTPFGGEIQLGGPIVAAALVVAGGFYLPPPEPMTFATTVFVHGPAGQQDAILRGQGRVVVDLEGYRRSEPIDDKGAAYFTGIPAHLRGRNVPIAISAEGFEPSRTLPATLSGDPLYLPVRKSPGKIEGSVTDAQGDPVPAATADVEGIRAPTDTFGRFELTIPGELLREEMTLEVRAPGFETQTHHVAPGSTPIPVRLIRRGKSRD